MRRLYKKILKLTGLCLALSLVAIFAVLKVGPLQKLLLQGGLRLFFQQVNFVDYKGNADAISFTSLELVNKTSSIQVANFKLQWQPWKLLLGRGLHIQNFEGAINFDIKNLPDRLNKPQVQEASLLPSSLPPKLADGLLGYLQLPCKFYLQHLSIQGQGHYKNIKIAPFQIQLSDLCPEQICNGKYSAQLEITQYAPISQVNLHGDIQLSENLKGKLDKLRVLHQMRIRNKDKIYPLCSLNIFAEEQDQKQYLKIEGHYGSANDLLITCNFFRKGSKAISAHWQGLFDHTILKTFLTGAVPTLSVMAEGQVNILRPKLSIETHTYVSTWVKDLGKINPTLAQLPVLSIKTELGANFNKDSIVFKQFNCLLKQKNTHKVFFNSNLLHPLTYSTDSQSIKPLQADQRVLSLSLKNIPCTIFEPFLHDYKLQGQIEDSNLEFSWDKNEWKISAPQPTRITQITWQNATTPIFENLQIKIHPQLSCNSTLNHFRYVVDLHILDNKHQQLLKTSQSGEFSFQKNHLQRIKTSGQGKIYGQGCAQQPYFSKYTFLNSMALSLHHAFEFDLTKKSMSLSKWDLNLYDPSTDLSLLTAQLGNPFACNLNELYAGRLPQNKGNLLTIKMDYLPLAILNPFQKYGQFSGLCSWEGGLKIQDNAWQFYTNKELCVNQGAFSSLNDTPLLHCHQLKLCPTLTYTPTKNLSFKLDSCYLQGEPDGQALLNGDLSLYWTLQKNHLELAKSKGKIQSQLDDLSLQGLLVDLPGIIGNGSIHWDFDKQLNANYHINLSPVKSPCTLDLQGSIDKDNGVYHLKGPIELRHAQHLSDANIALEFNEISKEVKAQLNSQSIQVGDLQEAYTQAKLFKDSFEQKLVPMLTSTFKVQAPTKTQTSVANNDNTDQISKKSNVQNSTPPASTKLLSYAPHCIENLNTQLTYTPTTASVKSTCNLLAGTLDSKITLSPSKTIKANIQCQSIDLQQGLQLLQYLQLYTKTYPLIQGSMDFKADLSCPINELSIKQLSGNAQLDIKQGTIKPFQQNNPTSQVVNGLTNTLGLLVGGRVFEMSTLGVFVSYCQSIPFQRLSAHAQFTPGQAITIKQACIKNDDLSLHFNGTVGLDEKIDMNQQAVAFDFQLNGKSGPLMRYLPFDEQKTDFDGYYLGPKVHLGGTLEKLDYSDLLRLLNYSPKPSSSSEEMQDNALENLSSKLQTIFSNF